MIDDTAEDESDSAGKRARQHSDEAHQQRQWQILQFIKHQGALNHRSTGRKRRQREITRTVALLQQKAVAAATAIQQFPG